MKRLSRNVASIALGEVGSRLLGFVAVAYLARVLEPENFGFVSIALAVFGYGVVLTSSGIPSYASRIVAQGEEREDVGDVMGLRVFLALCGVLPSALVLLFSGGLLQVLVFLYALSLVPFAVNLEWFFQGKETMLPIGWSRVAMNLVYALFLFLLVRSPEMVRATPVAFFLGNAAAAVLLASAYRARTGTFDFRWRPRSIFRRDGRWYEILRRSVPIGWGNTLTQISYNLPPVLLGVLSTTTAAAHFSAAGRFVFFLMVLDRLATTLLLPAIARYQKFSPDQLAPMLGFVQKIILILVFPVCVGGTILADGLMELIYGSDFSGAAPVLRVFIWFFCFSAAGSVYSFGLLGIGEEKTYGRRMAQGTAVQITLMVVGTIVWGEVGAAAGYAAGEAILFSLMYASFRKFVRIDLLPIVFKPLLSAALMGAILLLLPGYGLVAAISLGALVFFAALLTMKGMTKEDLTTLRAKLL